MKCYRCKTIKKQFAFPWKNKRLKLKRKMCKECYREYQKHRYYLRHVHYKKVIYNAKKKRVLDVLIKLFKYFKTHPCVDCGNIDLRVLDFDHVRGIKKYNVGEIIYYGYSWKTIYHEIEKCDVRCANCHRIKTLSKKTSWRIIFGKSSNGRMGDSESPRLGSNPSFPAKISQVPPKFEKVFQKHWKELLA